MVGHGHIVAKHTRLLPLRLWVLFPALSVTFCSCLTDAASTEFNFFLLLQHCICHITMDSFMGRGNQYIQLIKVLYCNMLTIISNYQLSHIGSRVWTETSEVGDECVTTSPPWLLASPQVLVIWPCRKQY